MTVSTSAIPLIAQPARPDGTTKGASFLARFASSTTVRFALVGSANTAIDFGLFLGLSTAGTPVLVANTISTTAGLVFSYFVNRRFTFGIGGRHDLRSALLFLATTGVGLWAVQPLVILGVLALLPRTVLPVVATGLGKIAGIAVGLVWNFVWYRTVVFRVAPARVR